MMKKLLCILIFFPCISFAKSGNVKSGTGFFVSNLGHIITNAHVIEGCKTIYIRGAVESKARIISKDKRKDLAVLRAYKRPKQTGILKADWSLRGKPPKVGDSIMIMGYPLQHGITGQYKVSDSIILGLKGPMNEPEWIQFSDAAQQGNSGGPVLDSSGNILGVVVGKATLVTRELGSNEQKIIKQSDIAISLNVLKRFLNNHHIPFKTSSSSRYVPNSRIEKQASNYIVNITCKPTIKESKARMFY